MPITNYIWDEVNDSYLMEADGNGDTTAVYTNEPVQYGNLISQRRNDETNFYHYDAQHSTRALTDEDENLTDTAVYTAFGETVAKSGSTVNPFGFSGALGYYANPESDDVYVRARTYQPAAVRWLSLDPLRFANGANRFSFVIGNPINFFDPSGLACCKNPPGTTLCGNAPVGMNYIGDRGEFKYVSLSNYDDSDDFPSWRRPGEPPLFLKHGSTFTAVWIWKPASFVNWLGCCCCDKVGYIQIENQYAMYQWGYMEGHQSWAIDKSIPPPDWMADTRVPCTGSPTRIELSDMPNARQFRHIMRMQKLVGRFETCVVCLEGNEGINPNGVTVYGCIAWGHDVRWDEGTSTYTYLRMMDSATWTGRNVSTTMYNHWGRRPSENWITTVTGRR